MSFKIAFYLSNLQSKAFVEALYKQGYPESYITKLVNKKHTETSQAKIKKYIKQYKTENSEARDSHFANMKFYKASGKYKQHIDAKFYRETKEHYYKEFTDQFKEGSPIIENELEDEIEDEIGDGEE